MNDIGSMIRCADFNFGRGKLDLFRIRAALPKSASGPNYLTACVTFPAFRTGEQPYRYACPSADRPAENTSA